MKKILLSLSLLVVSFITHSQTNDTYNLGRSKGTVVNTVMINGNIFYQPTPHRDTICGTVLYVDSSGVLSSAKGYDIMIDNICDSCFLSDSVYVIQENFLISQKGEVSCDSVILPVNANKWFTFIRKDEYQPFKTWNYSQWK
jgi:hypothetical protein